MSWKTLGGGGEGKFGYVQDSEPSDPDFGETWLDTSVNPPEVYVYADIGEGEQWIQTAATRKIQDNLDASVSSRATQMDIVSDGEAFPGGHIDQPISEAGGGINWSSLTFTDVSGDLDGAGYVVGFLLNPSFTTFQERVTDTNATVTLSVDGEQLFSVTAADGDASEDDAASAAAAGGISLSAPIPFDSSVNISGNCVALVALQ